MYIYGNMYICYIRLFCQINNHSKVFAIVSALVGGPLEAVVIYGEMVLLRAARIIFLIVIGFTEVV